MRIGVAGYTGWMGEWHTRVLSRAARELRMSVEWHLFARHSKPVLKGASIHTGLADFCQHRFDFLVIALHPEHRLELYKAFGDRLRGTAVLLEKPLSTASADLSHSRQLLTREHVFARRTLVNYPELFDPLTEAILAVLDGRHHPVPKLTIRQVHCFRCKDRESKEVPQNGRHTEPLAIQEGVHDVSFVLELLRRSRGVRRIPRITLISSVGTDLRHPSGHIVPLAGSSHSLFCEVGTQVVATVTNSFIDPYVRKEKVIVCVGADGHSYTVVANFQPNERRSLVVYDHSGKVVYDGRRDQAVRQALLAGRQLRLGERSGPLWNVQFARELLEAAANKAPFSNFELAWATEKYCQEAFQMQRKSAPGLKTRVSRKEVI